MNAHGSFIRNSQKLETTQMSLVGLIVKQTVAHPYMKHYSAIKKNKTTALTTVAKLGGCRTVKVRKAKVRQFSSKSGHMSRLGFSPWLGVCTRGNRSMFLSHINVSLLLFLPPFPSLLKINKIFKKKKNENNKLMMPQHGWIMCGSPGNYTHWKKSQPQKITQCIIPFI